MFCTKMRKKVRLLLNRFDRYVEEHVATALHITTTLKSMLESPVADILTAIIPGNADDIIKRQLIKALADATTALGIINKCSGSTHINDRLLCLLTELKQLPESQREAILHKLASLVASNLDGQRLKQSFYDLYTQVHYTASKVN